MYSNLFLLSLFIFALLNAPSYSLDNGLGLTPQMGWNSWNHFACNVSEDLIKKTADALISSGLASYGYNYINIDDCWQIDRDANGYIIEDPDRFPSGMGALADYIHSIGLKFGLYSDAGFYTCQHRPGSLGYEKQDATSYASWNVDYLKYDNCYNDGTPPEERYPPMRDALNATGHPIFFSMCEWGVDDPATWAADVGNSWRTTDDISDNWSSMVSILDQNNKWADYAGPGGWNDPDMLEVGNGGMSYNEYKAHFSLWCFIKSPLLIGNDIINMSPDTFNILTRSEVIAINQDTDISVGKKYSNDSEGHEVWTAFSKTTSTSYVILFNRNIKGATIKVDWSALGYSSSSSCVVRDLWYERDIGTFTGSFSSYVDQHSVVIVKITPKSLININ